MDLARIQSALRERKFDAWLFYDHHYRDPIAYRILGLPGNLHVTRRWYYLVPAEGEPQKLVHRIEPGHLDSLPGKRHFYSAWQEQHEELKSILAPYKTVAMQYSPNNLIPYISLVDGGTIELIRSFGKDIVSAGDLVAIFEATLNEGQIASHFAARDAIDPIMQGAFQEIGRRCKNGNVTDEYAIQKWILEAFDRAGLVSDSTPIVAVNANASNPHYSPSAQTFQPIKRGDFVLLDMWGKQKDRADSVFYDITWTGVVGSAPTEKQREVFAVVSSARDTGLKMLNTTLAHRKMAGWEVDKAVRDYITTAGYGQYFTHRTGHSIATEVHGNGANMDNLETKDERQIINNTIFSIEPGVYLPEFGVRAEYDVLVRSGKAEATGRVQTELLVV
jgi:Xaa-Pro aminopeptidase